MAVRETATMRPCRDGAFMKASTVPGDAPTGVMPVCSQQERPVKRCEAIDGPQGHSWLTSNRADATRETQIFLI